MASSINPTRPSLTVTLEEERCDTLLADLRVAAQINGIDFAEDMRGRVRPYTLPLHHACITIVTQGQKHVGTLGIRAEDMTTDETQLERLARLETKLLSLLRDTRAAKDQIKLRLVERTGTIMNSLKADLLSPKTPAADKAAIRTLSAEAQDIISSTIAQSVTRARTTAGRNEGDAAESHEKTLLRLENRVLRGEKLTLDDVVPAAAKTTRRRSRK